MSLITLNINWPYILTKRMRFKSKGWDEVKDNHNHHNKKQIVTIYAVYRINTSKHWMGKGKTILEKNT